MKENNENNDVIYKFSEPKICTFCSNKMGLNCFDESVLSDWKLKPPMHIHCAIEALIDKKISEALDNE